MKKHIKLLNLLLAGYLLIIALLFIFINLSNKKHDSGRHMSPAEKIISDLKSTIMPNKPLKVHSAIPYWEQEKAVETFKQNVEKYNSISMFWYYVNSDHEVAPYGDAKEDESVITFAHQHNIKVLALVTNLPDATGTTWSSNRVKPLLATKTARANHIKDLITLMDEKKFDGINIDYEELDDDLKDEFTAFINELSQELHKRGKLVGVALHPKSGEGIGIEDNGSRAQDWKELGKSADQLYLMAYGEHWDTSEAGPPASIPWDTKIVTYAKTQIPTDKIFLGIPLYGMRWEVGKKDGSGVLYTDVEQLLKEHNVKPVWDKTALSSYIKYTEDDTDYVVWFEDAQSVKEKIDLAKRNGLGGITFWHIGGADPAIWKLLNNTK